MGTSGDIFEISVENFKKHLKKSEEIGHVVYFKDYNKAAKELKEFKMMHTLITDWGRDSEFYNSLKDPSYVLLGEIVFEEQAELLERFGRLLEEKYPACYKYFYWLFYRLNRKSLEKHIVFSGYLMPEESKNFLSELEKLDNSKIFELYKEFLSRLTGNPIDFNHLLESFDERGCINIKFDKKLSELHGKPGSLITLVYLKELLKKAIKDNKVLTVLVTE